jgi:hypothetical protein
MFMQALTHAVQLYDAEETVQNCGLDGEPGGWVPTLNSRAKFIVDNAHMNWCCKK